jgi:hypothetical protein
MIKTHRFDSTSDAYDASQTDESISNGDVLVVESERVVGVLVDAWPVAVTPERGAFHTFAPDVDVARSALSPSARSATPCTRASTLSRTSTPRRSPPSPRATCAPASTSLSRSLTRCGARATTPEQQRLVPTGEPKTSDGDELLAAFPVGSRVAFEFEPDPDMPRRARRRGHDRRRARARRRRRRRRVGPAPERVRSCSRCGTTARCTAAPRRRRHAAAPRRAYRVARRARPRVRTAVPDDGRSPLSSSGRVPDQPTPQQGATA